MKWLGPLFLVGKPIIRQEKNMPSRLMEFDLSLFLLGGFASKLYTHLLFSCQHPFQASSCSNNGLWWRLYSRRSLFADIVLGSWVVWNHIVASMDYNQSSYVCVVYCLLVGCPVGVGPRSCLVKCSRRAKFGPKEVVSSQCWVPDVHPFQSNLQDGSNLVIHTTMDNV